MSRLKEYANLIIKTGVNVEKNQTIIISADVETAEFTRLLTEVAYKNGAKNVIVEYTDEKLDLIKYKEAPEEVFLEFPKFRAEYLEELFKEGACRIRLTGGNPDILSGVDPVRMANANKTARVALKKVNDYPMENKVQWCIAGVATPSWAAKVYPDLEEKEAVKALWEQILKASRVEEGKSNEAWEAHNINLNQKSELLTKMQLAKIHLKSAVTDLEIKLPENHIWAGGGSKNANGTIFQPNIPTEEIFTTPHKYGINGIVANTKPLVYNGSLIDNFTLTIENGKVIDYKAEKGQEILSKLLATDEGSSRFGEIALVPYSSPISKSGIVFFNTLFDENASIHLALGAAYSHCIEGAMEKSEKDLDKIGHNTSLSHEDFMIGSADMNIVGTTKNGEEINIFVDGEWAI